MSTLARRSVRTTAAAAGIAALGIGFAGPALAAPSASSLPELPALDTMSAPAVDSAVPGMDDFARAADTAHTSLPDLPGAFTFESPTVDADSVRASSIDPTANAPTDAAAVDPTSFAPSLSPSSVLPSFDPAAYVPSAGAASIPTEMTASELSVSDRIITMDGGPSRVQTSPEASSNDVAALPSLDSMSMFSDLAQQVAAGQSMTWNNDLG